MRERLGDGPVYVSVDIDVDRPRHGAGHRHARGRRPHLARAAGDAARPGRACDVVCADIVEVAPAYDHAEVTGIAAAHVGYELLSVMAR